VDVGTLVHGLFIVTAVFGVGVTAVDLLGLLGDHDDGGHHGDHGGLESGGHANGHDIGTDADIASDGHGGAHSLLFLLRNLRLAVYFCVGFGVLGLAAEFTGSGLIGALSWAGVGGVACAFLARAFFRFQSRDVDSSLREHELLAQPAKVIIPLSGKDMGKIRARLGQLTVERYALAESADESYTQDESVEIVRITDECVYVRRLSEPSDG
jgi:hypothetical protein